MYILWMADTSTGLLYSHGNEARQNTINESMSFYFDLHKRVHINWTTKHNRTTRIWLKTQLQQSICTYIHVYTNNKQHGTTGRERKTEGRNQTANARCGKREGQLEWISIFILCCQHTNRTQARRKKKRAMQKWITNERNIIRLNNNSAQDREEWVHEDKETDHTDWPQTSRDSRHRDATEKQSWSREHFPARTFCAFHFS